MVLYLEIHIHNVIILVETTITSPNTCQTILKHMSNYLEIHIYNVIILVETISTSPNTCPTTIQNITSYEESML